MKAGIIVEPIKNGTVIDHIEPGKAVVLHRFLRIPPEATMGLIVNVPSRRHGRKDMIFVEGLELTEREIAKIALLSRATLNIVRHSGVVTKQPLSPPDLAEGILRCPQPTCVTNHEGVQTRFKISPEGAACFYCESVLPAEEIGTHLTA